MLIWGVSCLKFYVQKIELEAGSMMNMVNTDTVHSTLERNTNDLCYHPVLRYNTENQAHLALHTKLFWSGTVENISSLENIKNKKIIMLWNKYSNIFHELGWVTIW